jgi:very-short-patch-repair endonuclease
MDPKQVSASDLVERLEGLIDTLAAIAEARTNEAYRSKLGHLYVGVETDWAKLEETVSWGQKFAAAVGSQSHAYTLAPRLHELAPAVATAAALMASANGELAPLREQLGLCGTTRISDAQAKLTYDRERLLVLLQPISDHQRLASSVASLSAAAQAFLAAHHLTTTLDEKRYRQLLGAGYEGVATDTDRLLRTARWLAGVREQGNLPDEVVVWLAATDTIARRNLLVEMLAANGEFWDSCTALVGRLSRYGEFAADSPFCGEEHDVVSLTELAEAATKCQEQVRYLVTWSDYRRTLARADGLGLGAVTEAIDSERIAPDESAAIYRHAVYDCMAREIVARRPELAGFTRAEFEGVRERYVTTDRQIMMNTQRRIGHITSSRHVPRGVSYGPVKNHTDRALIERELAKQKRHIPIRQLVRRAGRALQGLKPCFMMSPLSVAQYLEPGLVNFDLVMMDEASQLKPEDALGVICRAKQLVVVGDPHQLPPTSFFDRNDGGNEIEDDDAAAVQDTESILDICMTTYRKRRLRWHYRSQHESLIAFSNNRFYDNDLIIFPSPMGKHPEYGVHRHYIEGAAYLKGRNRLEAEAVAQAVIAHFRNTPMLSLGVATFNREQAELVLDILDRLQKEQPWLEQALKKTEQAEEPFFVKNLENVQGDERDVIFVVTTYGPDQTTGKVYQRFGPIAGDTGWRRLNVIFTRAKKRLELFTSLRSADIKLGENPSKGALALKQYLEYAETGLLPDYGTIGGREPDSDFEVAVAHHLHGHGFRTVAQVGIAGFFIDIGVLHPEREGEFVIGIECDGAAYHSCKSVRDRDRLRQEILERKGWRIHRIWSTDWFKNRDREIHRLLAAVRQAVMVHASVAVPAPGFQEAVAAAISSLHTESKLKVPTATEPTPAATAATAKTAKGLREELIEYRQVNILPSFPDEGTWILRDEILDRLVKQMPVTHEEFYRAIPIELRQGTDGKQMQFLDDILEIIDAYA